MTNGFKAQHWNDENGNPAGGSTFGAGFAISWQNGPIGRCTCPKKPGIAHTAECARLEPNGAFVEDIIGATIDRIRYYQKSRFACSDNANAIECLQKALAYLNERTRTREARGVEGTHSA